VISALLLTTVLQLALSEVPQGRVEGGEAPVELDQQRLRTKPPLTEAQKAAYVVPAVPAVKPRDSYTLAVVPLEFADHQMGATDVSKLVFGVVAEYYAKASSGRFTLKGKVEPKVTLSIDRSSFERKDLSKALPPPASGDGIAFIVAGGLVARNAPLWPHRGVVKSGDRELDYILVPEEAAPGILCHEFMPELDGEGWYVKAYFLSADAVFISVHP